ncbi:hypothetical protein TruAng_001778 [Truncatella angustata]|nr:hypothetical protein TruAng_001778 [Truncatella angustata]
MLLLIQAIVTSSLPRNETVLAKGRYRYGLLPAQLARNERVLGNGPDLYFELFDLYVKCGVAPSTLYTRHPMPQLRCCWSVSEAIALYGLLQPDYLLLGDGHSDTSSP